MRYRNIWMLLLGIITALNTSAQSNKELARTKGQQAVDLVDEGKFEEGIKLLEEAKKLDPDNYLYPYEIGYAYYAKEDYKKALSLFKDVVKFKDAKDDAYQMLGNLYDINGDSKKANAIYDEGLKLFPNSGRLYLEKGNMFYIQKQYGDALTHYEKGIDVEPDFASNYYRAAQLYLNSEEEVWGMIYGEIFMNIERGSKRTAEMSKLLYKTYKSEIVYTSDTSLTVSFSKNATVDASDIKNGKFKLPFGIGVYEPTLMLSVSLSREGTHTINLETLNDMRSRFVGNYNNGKINVNYPNLLFEYQKKIKDAGHMEAYNYWLLMKGNEDTYEEWQKKNSDKMDAFIEWFKANPMVINDKHKFSRFQY